MERKKIVGIILLVVGIIVLLLSLFADVIGIGTSPRFGYRHIVGIIAGAIFSAAGLFLILKK